jgi:hypothetical protein
VLNIPDRIGLAFPRSIRARKKFPAQNSPESFEVRRIEQLNILYIRIFVGPCFYILITRSNYCSYAKANVE